MSETVSAAFIGLGVMGYPMAGHLAANGHRVRVYNRTAAKAASWVAAHGGETGPSPAEAAKGADLVFCCVGNDDDLRAVIFGPDGALAGIDKGSVLVDHTTTSAVVAREVAAAEGAAVSQGCKVESGDTAVGPEADPHPGLHARPRASEAILLGSRDPEHDRTVDLAGQQRRHQLDRAAGDLATESPAAVLADHDHIFHVQTELARDRLMGPYQALRGRVDEEPPVLPVRHRGAWLHRVMRERLVNDGLVEDQVGFG